MKGGDRRVAERLLAEMRAEIGRADSKAAVLVAALGLSGGVLSGMLADQGWSAGAVAAPGLLLLGAGAAAMVVALVALLLAVLPRYARSAWRPGEPLSYFGDIRHAAQRDLLAMALTDTRSAPGGGLIEALAENSRIVTAKLRWVRVGTCAFALGLLLLPAGMLTA
jgi:hypothetical protein